MRMIKGVVIFVVSLFILLCVGRVETYYTREGIVTECNNDVIVVVDSIGEEWICDNCYNDVTKGCEVKMIMHNNHTNQIYDDIITNIKVK